MQGVTIKGVWTVCLAAVLCTEAAYGQHETQPATAPDDQPRGIKLEDLHWAMRLGARVEQINQAFKTVDRVVLVPDAATYVDELNKWSPDGRWPVLFEDNLYAPMFIRRFEPAQVIRRASVGKLPGERVLREKLLTDVVLRALGGQPGQHTLKNIFGEHRFQPPGVVFTSVNDDAWTAAVALAAGRGQPIVFLDENWGRVNGLLESPRANTLREQIDNGVAAQGETYKALGDTIETVTICRNMPGRIKDVSTGTADPIAMTDYLARNVNGDRYGFAGWIYGDSARCAYVAMCSLFLDRKDIALINTYPPEGQWSAFSMNAAQRMFNQRTYTAALRNGNDVSPAGWSRLLRGGLTTDVVLVNSKGNRANFGLRTGRAEAVDVPVLNTPAAVYFVHSWSFAAPGNSGTVGGQWVEHGAYAYVGAVHEPYLAAFVPPSAMAERLTQYVPFLVAARHWDGPKPFAGPWKVNTYGDPLMICRPPGQPRPERVRNDAGYGVDLKAHATDLLQTVRDDANDPATLAEAMQTLQLLGRDEMVIQLWSLAKSRGHESTCAGAAVGALFRAHDRAGVIEAFRAGVPQRAPYLDMLWHIAGPDSGSSHDKDVLLLLQSAVREETPEVDLKRLAPHLVREFSKEHALQVIERYKNRAKTNRTRNQLNRIADSIR